jgi:prepilin-type N-terminal cleavage/methylation domain-containing protein
VSVRRRGGFTLVELLVATALAVVLIGVVSFVFVQSSKIYSVTLEEVHASFVVRSGMDMIGRDLRAVELPFDPTLDVRAIPTDGPSGEPLDTLEYSTVEGGVPVNVRLQVDPTSGYLVRRVVARWNPGAGAWTPVDERSDLAADVVGFRVEYAWPDANGALQFFRGPPPSGGDPTNGTLFVFRGGGSIDADGRLIAGAAWSASAPPEAVAKSVHVMHSELTGSFPVLSVDSPGQLTLAGATRASGVQFVCPMLPPAVRITLQTETQKGKRTLQRVLPVTH